MRRVWRTCELGCGVVGDDVAEGHGAALPEVEHGTDHVDRHGVEV